jgi:hypothetical protein
MVMYFSVVWSARSARETDTLTVQVLVEIVLVVGVGLEPEAAAKDDFIAYGRGNDGPALGVLIVDAPAFFVGAVPVLPLG